MAYCLYISRPPHFASRIRRKITPLEWAALLATDAALAPEPADSSGKSTAAWYRADPHAPAAQLYYQDGNIVCRNPDEPTVDKLVAVAAALGAQVQGEDGEIHTGSAEPPYLVQFSLFERVSMRLRVRFPLPPTLPSSTRWSAVPEDASPEVGPEVPAEPPVEDAAVVAVGATEGASLPATTASTAAVSARRWRMKVGFPDTARPVSPAIAALVNPLRPVEVVLAQQEAPSTTSEA